MGIAQLKMRKTSDKMRQDGANMRKMDASRAFWAPLGGEDSVRAANSPASRGVGEG